MPVTRVPWPTPSDVENIDGTMADGSAASVARWRVYPTVLALAMFWPATSRACRWAMSELSAVPSPEKVLTGP